LALLVVFGAAYLIISMGFHDNRKTNNPDSFGCAVFVTAIIVVGFLIMAGLARLSH
jgi:hypothetical protein